MLYSADGELAEVRQELEAGEARVLASIIRRAAIVSAPPPLRKPRRGTARPPAAKKAPAKKPVPTSGA